MTEDQIIVRNLKQSPRKRSAFPSKPRFDEEFTDWFGEPSQIRIESKAQGRLFGRTHLLAWIEVPEPRRTPARQLITNLATSYSGTSHDVASLRIKVLPAADQLLGSVEESDVGGPVSDAAWIFSLCDNWDHADSRGYSDNDRKALKESLARWEQAAWTRFGIQLPSPVIRPGPDGTIDLHWRTRSFELLVNSDFAESNVATFYGDDFGDNSIEGTFQRDADVPAFLLWLLDQNR